MRVLYIALSCGPNLGSEDAVGWNVPMEMAARGHEVFVLTRSDKRGEIEEYKAAHPELTYPEFRYQPLSALAEKCRGPFYSLRAKMWCAEASSTVRALCDEIRPDVVHQLTPVEFRAPVDLSGLNMPLKVLGPVGGGGDIPEAFLPYLRTKDRVVEGIRMLLNRQAVHSAAVRRAFSSFDAVAAANEETRKAVAPMCRCEVDLRSEVAAKTPFQIVDCVRKNEDELIVGFAGRLHYRKGVLFLLDACARLDVPFRLLIAGDGPERRRIEEGIRDRAMEDRVELLGHIPYESMPDFYRSIDVFAFPSLREATGSVLVEALAAGLPVVSLGLFGANVVLAERPECLVDCRGVDSIADRFARALVDAGREKDGANNPQKIAIPTWSSLVAALERQYASLFSKKGAVSATD